MSIRRTDRLRSGAEEALRRIASMPIRVAAELARTSRGRRIRKKGGAWRRESWRCPETNIGGAAAAVGWSFKRRRARHRRVCVASRWAPQRQVGHNLLKGTDADATPPTVNLRRLLCCPDRSRTSLPTFEPLLSTHDAERGTTLSVYDGSLSWVDQFKALREGLGQSDTCKQTPSRGL